ncbi:hypothetical protein LK996_10145 [Lysobacter sp. A6]|uniref:Uncharacterized protein n=1 Tax=Noviluteimonas lactosilytica TaxID=2888523 RepID=A0ABS8JIK8_9GAMM|nr:hypothetical protein [Lysobacter lactosilyticus]MCC8363432.1 hypothetical protein [Lysobacter lactosilyticus]
MNRKLHNSVTALVATSGLLVLSLMAANPIRSHLPGADIAPVVQQVPAAPAPAANVATEARHAVEAAKRIEARAADLQARLAQTKNTNEAIGEIVGFAAEAATLASIAAAMDGVETGDAAIVDADTERSTNTPARKRAHGRQSVAMPFFSFAPRG